MSMSMSMSMIAPGDQIGNYRVVRLIGSGGMGVVFEAVHQTIGRRAAIKMLHSHLSQEPQVASRFLNEARAVNLVRHPGLVEIFEFGRMPDGSTYIIMDYLDGESLACALQRSPDGMSVAVAIDLVRQIAAALAAAHGRGIVHRDLKPDNIMLIPDVERPGRQRVKILDFGIAKLSLAEEAKVSPARTQPGMAMGTPAYMAPEQCLGADHVDGQADVYSLGIIFYELLSGRRPFESALPLDVMTQHVRAAPPPLAVSGIDERIALLVESMLAKAPGERPTMQQVAEAVARPTSSPDGGPAPVRLDRETAEYITAAEPRPHSLDRTLPGAEQANPFIVGPPITDPRQFYGRQRELKRLFSLWRRPPLQNAAIIGPTRSGKTSLLHYIKSILTSRTLRSDQRNDLISDPGRYRFLFVDFQDPRMGTQEGLLRHMLRGLTLPAPARCDLEQFMATVSGHLNAPTIILMDEIGVALQRYKELDTTFWEGLRALAINQVGGNLGFVLASTHPPHEIAQQHQGGGSPFFNIFGYSALLSPLSEAEARQLMGSSPIPFAEADILWILKHSGGWPLLVQLLSRERLHALYEQETGEEWKEDALRQLAPFRHLLQPFESR